MLNNQVTIDEVRISQIAKVVSVLTESDQKKVLHMILGYIALKGAENGEVIQCLVRSAY